MVIALTSIRALYLEIKRVMLPTKWMQWHLRPGVCRELRGVNALPCPQLHPAGSTARGRVVGGLMDTLRQ